jgi:hypothetical protein
MGGLEVSKISRSLRSEKSIDMFLDLGYDSLVMKTGGISQQGRQFVIAIKHLVLLSQKAGYRMFS